MKPEIRWFVSPRFDLVWLIASPLAAVAFYAAFLGASSLEIGSERLPLVFLFFLLFTGIFDAPHIFQTFSRTHLDPVERKRHFWLHGASLIAAVLISASSDALEWNELFMTLLGLYGAWHIIRQNAGFVKLYQRLNRDLEPADSRSESSLLAVALLFYYLHGHSDLEDFLRSGLGGLLSPDFFWWLQRGSEILLALIAARIFHSNWQVRREKGAWNSPKLLLMGATLALVFWLATLDAHPLLLIALSTIGHDLQYQAWMWIYNRRRTKRVFASAFLFGTSLVLGLVLILGPEQWTPAYNGLVLWHYFIDGFIWHFASSPELHFMLESKT